MITEGWEAKTLARFLSFIDKSGGASACWPWTGTLTEKGYGIFQLRGKRLKAHRISMELALGCALGDLLVCHHCDNPGCCNPLDLFRGTHLDNVRDAIAKGRMQYAGDKGPAAKTRWTHVEVMRELAAAGRQQKDIAKAFGLSTSCVHNIVKGKTWREKTQSESIERHSKASHLALHA